MVPPGPEVGPEGWEVAPQMAPSLMFDYTELERTHARKAQDGLALLDGDLLAFPEQDPKSVGGDWAHIESDDPSPAIQVSKERPLVGPVKQRGQRISEEIIPRTMQRQEDLEQVRATPAHCAEREQQTSCRNCRSQSRLAAGGVKIGI